jgi:beta-lactamase regulating signal transducer with metallopeptidase domain
MPPSGRAGSLIVGEQPASVLYFLQVHLLYTTLVCLGAWALSSVGAVSATVKYWIWLLASLNFAIPMGGFIDRFGALNIDGASQLRPLVRLDLVLIRSPLSVAAFSALWLVGCLVMLLWLALRIRAERRGHRAIAQAGGPDFHVEGVPVHYTASPIGPSVVGLIRSRIQLPRGIEHLLSESELAAVLMHEVTHAKRRDNLLRLVHEVVLCILWFNPLLWLSRRRLSLYRELSCDESVLRRRCGPFLVSALAKVASPESVPVLRSAATSLIRQRLERLLGEPPRRHRLANTLIIAAFGAVLLAGTILTVAHTACCLVPRG